MTYPDVLRYSKIGRQMKDFIESFRLIYIFWRSGIFGKSYNSITISFLMAAPERGPSDKNLTQLAHYLALAIDFA